MVKSWLRSVVPDLFLAAVVALLVTLAMGYFDGAETRRIRSDARSAAKDGLTLDERIEVVGGSIRRSTLVQLPALVVLAGVAVGLACRNRRWAWLTTVGAILPALIMGVAFFIDRPFPAGTLAATYTVLGVAAALMTGAVRARFLPATVRNS